MLWLGAEHEELTARPWDEAVAHEAIARIVAEAVDAEHDGVWPGHHLDDLGEDDQLSTLYLGSAGMTWGLWKLGSPLDASDTIARAIRRYRARPDFDSDAHAPSTQSNARQPSSTSSRRLNSVWSPSRQSNSSRS